MGETSQFSTREVVKCEVVNFLNYRKSNNEEQGVKD